MHHSGCYVYTVGYKFNNMEDINDIFCYIKNKFWRYHNLAGSGRERIFLLVGGLGQKSGWSGHKKCPCGHL